MFKKLKYLKKSANYLTSDCNNNKNVQKQSNLEKSHKFREKIAINVP